MAQIKRHARPTDSNWPVTEAMAQAHVLLCWVVADPVEAHLILGGWPTLRDLFPGRAVKRTLQEQHAGEQQASASRAVATCGALVQH